jgi:hypothetical protein
MQNGPEICIAAGHRAPVLLIGAPRSGTTWVAKIFDSSPDVLYRHEPDTVVRDPELAGLFEPEDYPRLASRAAAYVQALIATRDTKSTGSRPHFPKAFRSAAGNVAHASLVASLHAVELALGPRVLGHLPVPDMLRPGVAPLPVIKTINSRGRAGLFAHAWPGAQFVLLLRDPVGQIGSWLHGMRSGHMPPPGDLSYCTASAQARRYGITRETFLRLGIIEQLAWHWALMNEKAHEDLRDVPGTVVVRLSDVVADPEAQVRRLFAAAGIAWSGQTQRFLRASTRAPAVERYFQVYRDSSDVLTKWHTRLREDDRRRIGTTLSGTAMLGLFPEIAEVLSSLPG